MVTTGHPRLPIDNVTNVVYTTGMSSKVVSTTLRIKVTRLTKDNFRFEFLQEEAGITYTVEMNVEAIMDTTFTFPTDTFTQDHFFVTAGRASLLTRLKHFIYKLP